ncbi:hypothetical protein B0H66DRAFT_525228 [Apodospora peruviana]|uniref:Rhodopsin domain-containing protein n=1 Tax=Apodospora peruviana TaxID=516989 RepID=A0AAE0LY59_9PEZI|nr:hypothetical protein B0H66DRAFT_525228 [Apodospora peruviana]
MAADIPASLQARAHEMIVLYGVCLAMALFTTLLRCFTRLHLVKAFGFDDGCMLVATILYTAYIAVGIGGLTKVATQAESGVTAVELKEILLLWWICMLLYGAAMMLVKVSVGLLLLRVATARQHRGIIQSAIGFGVASLLSFFFLMLFQCHPVRLPTATDQEQGSCASDQAVIVTAYVGGLLNMATDIVLALLPGFIIWPLQMKVWTKVAVIFVMGLGCLTSAAVLVRSIHLHELLDAEGEQEVAELVAAVIWTTAEQCLGIIGGNLATLRPLGRLIVAWAATRYAALLGGGGSDVAVPQIPGTGTGAGTQHIELASWGPRPSASRSSPTFESRGGLVRAMPFCNN